MTSLRASNRGRIRRCREGSALLAVIWLIAVLGMVMYAAARALDTDAQFSRVMRGRIYAKRYAEAGIEVGRHPAMQPGDPLLRYSGDDGGGYEVELVAEEARFNINVLIQSGDQMLMRRLFAHWGLNPDETAALIDALKDWVDPDELVSLNGAEKREYEKAGFAGMPFNRPFRDLDEMLLVRGMEQVDALRPDWRNWFTVFGDGRVDVNDATAELISVLAEVPRERVAPLMTFRSGPDGILHTRDDNRLTTVPQLAQMLGAYQPHMVEQLTRWVQFNGPIRRIESVGAMGDVRRRLVMVSQGQRVLWRGEVPAL